MVKDERLKYGQALRELRVKKGKRVSDMSSGIGVGRATISEVERGARGPFVPEIHAKVLTFLQATTEEATVLRETRIPSKCTTGYQLIKNPERIKDRAFLPRPRARALISRFPKKVVGADVEPSYTPVLHPALVLLEGSTSDILAMVEHAIILRTGRVRVTIEAA